jgi:hypothetical protein
MGDKEGVVASLLSIRGEEAMPEDRRSGGGRDISSSMGARILGRWCRVMHGFGSCEAFIPCRYEPDCPKGIEMLNRFCVIVPHPESLS